MNNSLHYSPILVRKKKLKKSLSRGDYTQCVHIEWSSSCYAPHEYYIRDPRQTRDVSCFIRSPQASITIFIWSVVS